MTTTNYCTPSGAKLLANMIESYWRKRDVATIKCHVIGLISERPGHGPSMFVVRSNLGMWEPAK